MHGKRTQNWYRTRLLLAVAIGLIAVSALSAWFTTQPIIGPRQSVTLGPLDIPVMLFTQIVALILALVGFIWMIRIVRGPSDKPPRWRYRDR